MINNEIKAKTVNLVVEGQGLQRMSLKEALSLAEEEQLDLVCVNEKSEEPIVKIMDYGKYVYQKQKKEKDNKKKARLNSQDIKEVHISESIAEHDLKIKAKNIDRMLKGGDKVKLVIKYKGRSIKLINHGPDKLNTLASYVSVRNVVDKPAEINGNTVTMILAPSK